MQYGLSPQSSTGFEQLVHEVVFGSRGHAPGHRFSRTRAPVASIALYVRYVDAEQRAIDVNLARALGHMQSIYDVWICLPLSYSVL